MCTCMHQLGYISALIQNRMHFQKLLTRFDDMAVGGIMENVTLYVENKCLDVQVYNVIVTVMTVRLVILAR